MSKSNSARLSKSGSRDWGIIQKRERSGAVSWYARITRIDGSGKKRQYTAKADNKTHARKLRDELTSRFSDRGERSIEGNKMRFRQLADLYEEGKLFNAEYHLSGPNPRKVAGVRSLLPSRHYLRVLREAFGSQLVNEISHSHLESFRRARLKTQTLRGDRSIADVNRTLELMRAVLRYAQRNGWINRSPFEMGSSLISKADEHRRERVLTFEEEHNLLTACDADVTMSYMRNGKLIQATRKAGRDYLRALMITAIDTAMRRGELLTLTWDDVDFTTRLITITAFNSKTARERKVGMTPRVVNELEALWSMSPQVGSESVFGIADNFKIAFSNLLQKANISDLRFHDFRHTAITRMINAGLPPMEIMKISGHTQWNTFARYVNPGESNVRRVADVLAEYAERMTQVETNNSLVN